MSFKVEFTFETLAELQKFVNHNSEKIAASTPDEIATPVARTAGKIPPVAKGPVPSPVAPEAPKKKLFEKPKPAVEELTYEYVKQATLDAVQAGKRPEVLAILAEFGVEKALELKDEQWADYMKRVGTLLKAKKEEELV